MTAVKILKDAGLDYLRSQGLIEPLTPHALASTRMWERFEHREKMAATNAKRRADPVALAAMRERLDRNRMPPGEVADAISRAYFRKFGWGGFASNDELTNWVVSQYQAGASAREISLAVGMSHSAVVSRLRAHGIEVSTKGAGRRRRKQSAFQLAKLGIFDMAAFDAEVATLYREGRSVNAIKKAYGVGACAIRTSLLRSGLVIRGKYDGISDLAAFDAEVAALYRDGHSMDAIAEDHGVSAQMIRTSLQRSGVEPRGLGDARRAYLRRRAGLL